MALTDNADPAPANSGAYRSVGSVSSGSTVVSFDSAQGGRKAHYLAPWVTVRNLSGPWSEGAKERSRPWRREAAKLPNGQISKWPNGRRAKAAT